MPHARGAQNARASVQSKTARVQSVFDHRRSAMSYRPGIVPGHEVNDTEFEEDGSDLEEYSGRRSEDSMGKSSTTLSSVDEVPTPDTQNNEFSGFNFDLSGNMMSAKSVQGPSGPHLFRMSTASTRELDFHVSMSPPESPEQVRVPIVSAKPARRSRQPEPRIEGQSPRTSVPLRTWTPMQVAEWMHASGFDHSIVETFFINDIAGPTLIDLQYEDLKELGIASFGQRHRLWNEIRALKEEKLADGFEDELVFDEQPQAPPSQEYPEVPQPATCSSPATPEDEAVTSPTSGRRRRRKPTGNDMISPAESASIVAIEQLLPKPHKCSKGENCAKWQKQQRKLARIATEFPMEMAQIVNAQAHSPTNSGVATASVFAPSVVASSDLLGKSQPPVRLEEDNLKTLQSRDPQENVRQFLTFQHYSDEKPEGPGTPPYEMFPTLSPPQAQAPHHHLSSLPKLTIPIEPAFGAFNNNRTAKPGDYRKQSVASPLQGFNISQYPVIHDPWRIGTPASEMDVPVTAIPLGPIERDVSSSVPPDMRFGAVAAAASMSRSSSRNGYRGGPPPAFHMPSAAMSPIISRSHSVNHSRRIPSLTTAPPPLREEPAAEAAIEEPVSPTEIDADGDVTPTATQPGYRRNKTGDAHHDGWMKKRRTRMLRHEWQDAHFRLRGTQLAMHEDERAAAALEYIDVDDYAVAVSGAPGDSKLNAAMRRLHLNNKRAQLDSHAFAFQLTPAAERKGIRHAATGKTHHFAVRTATERIDWMRELMLARARREKGVDIASFD